MTAVAGFVSFFEGELSVDGGRECARMIAAQSEYGPDALDIGSLGSAHFGRALYRRFHEDHHDCQPLRCHGTLLVADARIDNREQLCGALGIATFEARALADSDLVFRSWRRWGEEFLDRLCGTYAVAIWESAERRLILARDPFGQAPLHLAIGSGWAAFASIPQALRTLPGIDGRPDLASLAAFVADLPRRGTASYFKGIERVEPGEILTITPSGIRRLRHARTSSASSGRAGGADLVEAYRFHLDQAVESCLRGVGTAVAAHLSGGWDSAAIASSAALQMMPSGRIIGFTAAPPRTFAGGAPSGRIADESAGAAAVAARHSNLDHRVIRDRSQRPLALLDRNNRMIGEPTGYVCNNQWWTAVNQAASGQASVLLTAEMGNHTLSAGGAMQLADLVRTGQARRWLHEARGLVGRRQLRWTGVLDQSVGPFLPYYEAVRPWLAQGGRKSDATRLIAPGLRSAIERRWQVEGVATPPRNSAAHRRSMLSDQDCGLFRKASLARWGIDERDPTTERRFVDFCLSLPPEALLRDGVARPLARQALSDRLPPAILEARTRGLQFADWHEQISPGEVRDILSDPGVGELFDISSINALVDRWPVSGFDRPSVIRTYRMDLMRAASAASFLRTYGGAESASTEVLVDTNVMEESRPPLGREKQE
jgi:asparagine synthase (glutamine-hydrolysing)